MTCDGLIQDDEEACDKEQVIRADIRNFIQQYSDEHKLTGRVIARVFQGIDSPRYPATVWGRVRKFWRSHLDTDFHWLRKIATREILRARWLSVSNRRWTEMLPKLVITKSLY